MVRALGWVALIAAVGPACSPARVWAGFPYLARIVHDTAYVRCGPGQDYYATDTLQRGQSVEVYRQDAGGWLAIRPPEGSFSWVPVRQVQAASQRNVVVVSASDTVAWVGSRLGGVAEHKWQVRLNANEHLEVFGHRLVQLVPDAPSEDCYQVAPPAGEFRWVHQSDVQLDQPSASAVSEPVALTHFQGTAALEATPQVLGPLHDEFVAIQVELSRIVATDVRLWDFRALKRQLESLRRKATSDAARAAVAQRLDSIEQYERLQDRLKQLASGKAVPERVVSTQSASEEARRAAEEQLDADTTTTDSQLHNAGFDATGWLMPVHTTRYRAPPYALLDDDGNVVKYVTPVPGLNLRRYVRKKVGVFGQDGYLPELKTAFVLADRVKQLR